MRILPGVCPCGFLCKAAVRVASGLSCKAAAGVLPGFSCKAAGRVLPGFCFPCECGFRQVRFPVECGSRRVQLPVRMLLTRCVPSGRARLCRNLTDTSFLSVPLRAHLSGDRSITINPLSAVHFWYFPSISGRNRGKIPKIFLWHQCFGRYFRNKAIFS